jgi:hypothetical protein
LLWGKVLRKLRQAVLLGRPYGFPDSSLGKALFGRLLWRRGVRWLPLRNCGAGCDLHSKRLLTPEFQQKDAVRNQHQQRSHAQPPYDLPRN